MHAELVNKVLEMGKDFSNCRRNLGSTFAAGSRVLSLEKDANGTGLFQDVDIVWWSSSELSTLCLLIILI